MIQKYFKPNTITVLLQQLYLNPVTIAEKEERMKQGEHYSNLVVKESPLDQDYLEVAESLYTQELSDNIQKLANTVIQDAGSKPIVLISLVRAGIPLAISMKQAIDSKGKSAEHYAISIIRDFGLDKEAFDRIRSDHPDANYYFVDGWTGKGTIATELSTCIKTYIDPSLVVKLIVYADPAKCAWLSVVEEDCLLPFGMYNSVGFGLLSRTVLTDTGYHGAYLHEHLQEHLITKEMWCGSETDEVLVPANHSPAIVDLAYQISKVLGVPLNSVKSSLLETIRAVLRRSPREVLIYDLKDSQTQVLIKLCKKRDIFYRETKDIAPYKACAILG